MHVPQFFQVHCNWLKESSIWFQPGLNQDFLALAPVFSARSATGRTEDAVASDEQMSLISQRMDSDNCSLLK